jgi:hypothetical protein
MHLEQEAEVAGVAVAGSLRAVEVGAIVLIGLLVCPPLAILTVLVVVPMLVIGLVVGLLAAVLATPYLLVQHLRGNHGHVRVLRHRLSVAGRSILELAPHRIHQAAR